MYPLRFIAPLVAALWSCAPQTNAPNEMPCTDDTSLGLNVGERLPNAPVESCEGTPIELHSTFCGESFTLVDVGAALFQQCVTATEIYASDAAFNELQDRGLKIVQIFTTDQNGIPADATFCEQYTSQFEIDFEFLIDPFANTDAFGPIHPLAFLLNSQGVILRKWEGNSVAELPEEVSALMEANE